MFHQSSGKMDRLMKEQKMSTFRRLSRWIKGKKKEEPTTNEDANTRGGRIGDDGFVPATTTPMMADRRLPIPPLGVVERQTVRRVKSVEDDGFRATTPEPLGFYVEGLPVQKQGSASSVASTRSFETINSSRPSAVNEGSVLCAFENLTPPGARKFHSARRAELIKMAKIPLSPRANPSWYRRDEEKKPKEHTLEPTEYRVEIKRSDRIKPRPLPLDLFADCSDVSNLSEDDNFRPISPRPFRNVDMRKPLPLSRIPRLNRNASIGSPPPFAMPTPENPSRMAVNINSQSMNIKTTAPFDDYVPISSRQEERKLERGGIKLATPPKQYRAAYLAASSSPSRIPTPSTREFRLPDGTMHKPTEVSRAVLESRRRRAVQGTPLAEKYHNPERMRLWNDVGPSRKH